MSIQYMVLGFQPTTFGTWVASRPLDQGSIFKRLIACVPRTIIKQN